MLAMDSTTLTRTLAIMSRRGWIAKRRGADRREWRMALSRSGEAQLKRASPSWERAQAHVHARLGDEVWLNLMKLTNQVTDAVTERGGML
jgi:DNA-binding MarR family transcriptional regulator